MAFQDVIYGTVGYNIKLQLTDVLFTMYRRYYAHHFIILKIKYTLEVIICMNQ